MPESKFVNYYDILDLSPNAPDENVREAYIKAAKKYHPDRGGTVSQMKLVNEAYEILGNPNLRLQYDEVYNRYVAYKKESEHSTKLQNDINEEFQLILQARQVAKSAAKKGAIWFTIGTLVTIGTYSGASDGGSYFFAWGPMLFGGWQLIKGLYYYFNPHALLKKTLGKNAPHNLKNKAQGTKAVFKIAGIAIVIFFAISIVAAMADSNKPSGASATPTAATSSRDTSQLTRMKAAYDYCVSEFNDIDSKLSQINGVMASEKAYDLVDEFNSNVPQQNALVRQQNSKYDECEALRNSYNQSLSSLSTAH